MSKQMTVDQLLEKLSSISRNGHGDMLIFLGENYPLLEDAIGIRMIENKLLIRNTYYDKKMTEALRKAADGMKSVYRTYLEDCYKAGRDVKEMFDDCLDLYRL